MRGAGNAGENVFIVLLEKPVVKHHVKDLCIGEKIPLDLKNGM
jgi:hypothetical protein